jgi:hypothetical protein
MGLVADRHCGDCTVCCTVGALATPRLRKAPNTACPNSTGTGCAIYAARPAECRDSHCGWRFYPELDEAWRPDLSGVLVLTEHDVPASHRGRVGLKLLLVEAERALPSERLVGYLCALMGRGVPVFLSVQGPPGHWPVKAFLNDRLGPAIGRRDVREVGRIVAQLERDLRASDFERAKV